MRCRDGALSVAITKFINEGSRSPALSCSGRITAAARLRAAGTAAKLDCTPISGSALLNKVVMPAVGQAERAFSAALARIKVEDLARSAATLQNESGPTVAGLLGWWRRRQKRV